LKFALLVTPVLLFAGLRTELGWEPGYWRSLRIGLALLFLLQIVYQILLVAVAVQKESPFDPRAYWLTRPISRRGLPAAKLLWLVSLVALPQIVQGALMGLCFPGGVDATLGGAATMALLAGVCLILALPGAAVTRNSGQALLVVIALPVSVALLDAFLLRGVRISAQSGLRDLVPAVLPLELVLIGLTACFILVGFREQYRRHGRWGRWRSFGPALLLFFLGINMPPAPRPIPESTLQPPEGAELEVTSLTYELETRNRAGGTSTRVERERELWFSGGPGAAFGLSGTLQWRGLPDHWLAVAEPIRSYGPDGRMLAVNERRRGISHYNLNREYKRMLFPGYDPMDRFTSVGPKRTLFSSRDLNPVGLSWPAEFSTVVATRFYEPEKVSLPLAEGARWEIGGKRTVVTRIDADGRELRLRLEFLRSGSSELSENRFDEGIFAIYDPDSDDVVFGRMMHRSTMRVNDVIVVGEAELDFDLSRVEGDGFADREGIELYAIDQRLMGIDVRRVNYALGEGEGRSESGRGE